MKLNLATSLFLLSLSAAAVSAQTTWNGATVSNTGGPFALNGAFELTADQILSGNSSFLLNGDPTSVNFTQIGTNGTDFTLFNQTTLLGGGLIGSNSATFQNLSLNNSGTINANLSLTGANTLTIGGTGGSIVNTGLFEATNGGILNLNTQAAINNNGGNITASGTGSTVQVTNVTVQGGTFNTSSGGVIETVGTSTLDGSSQGAITLSDGSTYTAGLNSNTKITGTLNLGTVTGSNLALGGALELVGNLTLAGPAGATVTMVGNPSGVTGGQIGTNGNDFTLNNQVTIQGSGLIGSNAVTFQNLSLNNTGTINANTNAAGANTLTVGGTGGSIVNTGLLEATNGGTLNLTTQTALNNSGGNITANGGTVDVTNTTIQGGTLNTSSGGVMQTIGTSALDGSSQGAITLSDGSTYTAGLNSNTKITGTLNLGTVTGSNLALGGALELVGNLTLTGPAGATVTMVGNPSGVTGGQIGTNGNDFTLNNQVTIQGSGLIGSNAVTFQNLSLNNTGTINANTNAAGANTLTVGGTGGSIVNTGLLEATNGGTLNLTTQTALNNSGGNITANGGTVDVTNTTIQGGTLNTSSGGVMQTVGDSTLDAASQGAITLSDGSTYTAGTGLTSITGTLNLGTTTGSTLALGGQLRLVGNTTFQGPGVVTMSGDPSGPTGGQIGTNGNGYTLTNTTTIQGSGLIGSNLGAQFQNLNFSNSGTVNANTSGQTLEIGGTGQTTNTGTLEATSGGTLQLATSNPINNAGGTILADGTGSAVQVSTTLQGGTLTTSHSGTMGTVGDAMLDASTEGAITLTDGSTYSSDSSAFTSITGILNLGTTTGSTLALGGQLRLLGNTTFQGPGVVTMSGDPSGPTGAQIGTNGNGYTLTNTTTIQGSGLIGSNLGALFQNLNFNNSGTVNANTSGQTLEIGGTGQNTNTGTLEATSGGTLVLATQNPLNNAGGTILADGAGSAVQVSNTTLQGGILTTSHGGTMGSVGTVTLDGSTQGPITLSDGSTYTSDSSAFTRTTGALNLGTTTGSNLALSGQMQLVGNTTLSGPGTLSLTGSAQIGTNGNGYTLNNGSTIQGSGLIGSNVGALFQNLDVNNSGTVNANLSGQTLSIAGTGSLTNSGLLEATSGGVLSIAQTAVNNAGGNIEAGAGSSIDFVDGTTVTGGFLHGTGTINGNITDDGSVYFGHSETDIGTLTEIGNYSGAGTTYETIGADGNSQFDLTGDLNLGGTLDIDVLAGTALTTNETFTFINYSGSWSGTFSSIIGSEAGDWTINYNFQPNIADPDVVLTYDGPDIGGNPPGVPDATSAGLLLGLSLIGLALIARRARRAA